MSISMYRLSVGTFTPMLQRMLVFFSKTEADAQARGFSPDVLLDSRLAPDMFPLVQQVRYATDIAKGASARLVGTRAPSFPDPDRAFADLRERVTRTLDYLGTISEADMAHAEDRPVTVPVNGAPTTWPGRDYLLNLAAPNFQFHATTTYVILRANGVPLGKRDFLGIEG